MLVGFIQYDVLKNKKDNFNIVESNLCKNMCEKREPKIWVCIPMVEPPPPPHKSVSVYG